MVNIIRVSRKEWRAHIRFDVRKQQESRPPEQIEAGFLKHARPLDIYMHSPPEACADLLAFLLGRRRVRYREKWLHALGVLLANLLEAGSKPIAFRRDVREWSHADLYGRPARCVIELVNCLHEEGYIAMKTALFDKSKDRRTELTRIWASERLLREFPSVSGLTIIDTPKRPVELRKRGTHELLYYKDTAFTRTANTRLKEANRVNRDAEIMGVDDLGQYFRLTTHLRAIFLDKFTLYGRLHTGGGWHLQGLSKQKRRTITINDQPITELDYSGLHPRLLYAAEGIQYDPDPYTQVVRHLATPDVYMQGWSDRGRSLRKCLKTSLLILLNVKQRRDAERAVNNWLYGFHGDNHASEEEQKDLAVLGIIKARPVLEAFYEVHDLIASHFCSDTGMRLMNKDAKIALDIVWHFIRQSIPCLPIHDSYIVQEQYEDELRGVMDETYRKHSDGFSCPILPG